MGFAELLQAVRANPEAVVIPAQWGQGRASFGGLVVAMLHEAMRAKVPQERLLRSLAVTFVGPAVADTPVRFEVEVLREGKAVSQLLGRALQEGQVVTLIQGSFGAGRESMVTVEAAPAPQVCAPEASQALPFVAGVMPEFTRYIDLRWVMGSLPFTGSTERDMGGWMRLREHSTEEPMSDSHLVALVDAWPPAVLAHLPKPAPGSSLTWTIELIHPRPQLNTADWCLYRAHIEQAHDGYSHIAASVWSQKGELLAISRQTVTVFG